MLSGVLNKSRLPVVSFMIACKVADVPPVRVMLIMGYAGSVPLFVIVTGLLK